jgi:DNA polymerase III epsilon subunit-like protein
MSLVFIDTETTGLDPNRHEVWELAYAVGHGDVRSGTVYHSLRNADPTALRLNGYHDRVTERAAPADMQALEEAAKEALTGNTLVAANPAFDAAFLRARWGEALWRYRLLDVETFAAGVLGWAEPRGLRDITSQLVGAGFKITKPDHSAGADVETLRSCYYALRTIQEAQA